MMSGVFLQIMMTVITKWRRTLCYPRFRQENNMIRIKGELDPVESTSLCEDELRKRSGGSIYVHDLLLLGMGEDGHTPHYFQGLKP